MFPLIRDFSMLSMHAVSQQDTFQRKRSSLSRTGCTVVGSFYSCLLPERFDATWFVDNKALQQGYQSVDPELTADCTPSPNRRKLDEKQAPEYKSTTSLGALFSLAGNVCAGKGSGALIFVLGQAILSFTGFGGTCMAPLFLMEVCKLEALTKARKQNTSTRRMKCFILLAKLYMIHSQPKRNKHYIL